MRLLLSLLTTVIVLGTQAQIVDPVHFTSELKTGNGAEAEIVFHATIASLQLRGEMHWVYHLGIHRQDNHQSYQRYKRLLHFQFTFCCKIKQKR